MDRLLILRDDSSDEGTFGVAMFNGRTWHSLELPWRDNEPDLSCVPEGVYHASLVDSPRFKRMVYLLQGVPGRTRCEVHPANWAGDTTLGWHSDLEGCTTMGISVGELTPEGKAPQLAVLNSDVAIDQLLQATGGADIEIEYRWKNPLPVAV